MPLTPPSNSDPRLTGPSSFSCLFHSGISITHLLLSRIPPTYRLGKLVYSHFLLFSILLDTKTPFPHTESLYSSGSLKKCFSLIPTPFPGFFHSSGYDKWVFTLLNTSSIQHLNASLLWLFITLLFFHIVDFFFCFNTEACMQAITHARQALYTPSPHCAFYIFSMYTTFTSLWKIYFSLNASFSLALFLSKIFFLAPAILALKCKEP